MKGYGEDTESERGSLLERISDGAVTRVIQRLDELYPMYEKRVRKYFSQFPRTNVNSIIRDGWQVTYHLRTHAQNTEIDWCRLALRIRWPSANYDAFWNLDVDWNKEIEGLDPERVRWENDEDIMYSVVGHRHI